MRILLINPPHTAIGSRIPGEQLPPLGLLSVGGPLIDAGHDVTLLDAEHGPMSLDAIRQYAVAHDPEAILFGHSGSTSIHPTVATLSKMLARAIPGVVLVYGGVFPTYHWREVLTEEPQIDVIVRGEGEATAVRLLNALCEGTPLESIPGLAFRGDDGTPHATPPAPVITDLEDFRIGWELIDHADYGYWGGKRAVVVQFSRGCPHLCNYCGQRGFWTTWRHRDPVRFAAEIATLHREHGVEVFNFADENPSASRKAWKAFLEALIAEDVSVTLVGSTRADDIVRDADILHLYKKAGFERFLLGMENTDEATLKLIKKGGTTNKDREAVRLMRQHGILSMATWVVGFEEESPKDLLRGLRQILSYDPDQIQALYVTPHRWTPFFRHAADRTVIQTDQRKWDYKHQVLHTRHLKPWQLLAMVKAIEVAAQTRPRAIKRLLTESDPKIRHAQWWYYRMGRRVWFHEVGEFIREHRALLTDGPSLRAFWGAPQDAEEESMSKHRVRAAK
ncbi:MAG: anaerobic magnesium-protoporphyrin IX monomethyl ester cyclase [Myxococcota bacterium]|jgi:anaerobic magnesium-protoporphyrin IX monomethyl ester cyclase